MGGQRRSWKLSACAFSLLQAVSGDRGPCVHGVGQREHTILEATRNISVWWRGPLWAEPLSSVVCRAALSRIALLRRCTYRRSHAVQCVRPSLRPVLDHPSERSPVSISSHPSRPLTPSAPGKHQPAPFCVQGSVWSGRVQKWTQALRTWSFLSACCAPREAPRLHPRNS